MSQSTLSAYERVNITLPKNTLRLIDRITRKRNRSGFVDRAVHFYVAEATKNNLKKQLRAGAKAHSERDSMLAGEWFPIDSSS